MSAAQHCLEGDPDAVPKAARTKIGEVLAMESQLDLLVSAQNATDEEIAGLTRELAVWIRDKVPECEVGQQTLPGPKGARGLLEVLGSLGLKFFEPGALKALIDCLAIYIKERRPQVGITIQNASGANVRIDAGGLRGEELDNLIRGVRDMVDVHPVART
jgi:hypothetical protein